MTQPITGWPDATPALPVVDTSTSKSPEERKAILAAHVAAAISRGARVESQSDYQAVVVFGRRVNHVLHAILSILLLGLWLIVWLLLAITGGERRQLIQVDDYGKVVTRPV